uniref:Uncharacterized protein n=1 Tax=Tetranychus urticae TaxID=32264 RepID=T1KMH7_TETUR
MRMIQQNQKAINLIKIIEVRLIHKDPFKLNPILRKTWSNTVQHITISWHMNMVGARKN